MIYGIGTDIVLISRIKNTEAFAKKILSNKEFILWKDYLPGKQKTFLAKQFALPALPFIISPQFAAYL